MRKTLLDTILDPHKLSVRFQPIFHIGDSGHRVHSVEALIRGPRGTLFESALILFDYVRRKRAERAVDQITSRFGSSAVRPAALVEEPDRPAEGAF